MAYSVIDKHSSFMNPLKYTGDASTQAVTGVGFQPDIVWIKNMSTTSDWSGYDSVRGTTKALMQDNNGEEQTYATGLTAFGADGFTVGAQAIVNGSGNSIASMNWKAGTTSGIAGSPSITPTSYSFNSTSGVSVIAYTGTGSAGTLPHGLGVAPELIIQKNLADAENWQVYHKSMGATKYMTLNTTNAESAQTSRWNDTAPTSTLFTIGSDSSVNGSGENCIAYCFAPVKGFSKFNYFKGNAEANGPMIYTGFKPAFLVIKRMNAGADYGWGVYDNKRAGYNDNNRTLYFTTSAEDGGGYVNFFSNGFKMISSSAWQNSSNNLFLYWAFGQPIVGSNGVTATAR